MSNILDKNDNNLYDIKVKEVLMNHELLKQVIFDQHEVIRNTRIVPRRYQFEKNGNYVLTGLRRAGKSTLLYSVVKSLVESGINWNRIIYINFEDERLSEFTSSDFNDILGVQAELSGMDGFFFFDEIQNITGWEKFARRMADSNERAFITGSNSTMLSSDIESSLGGRYLTMQVFPYSFEEYLTASGIPFDEQSLLQTKASGRIRSSFDSYLKFGGMPASLLYVDKREYVSSVFNKILLGDIARRNGIRNSKGLELLMKKLAESVKDSISFSRLHGILQTIGFDISKDTVINYVGYAVQSFLVFGIRNYYSRFADREGNQKYYFADNGILNLFLMNHDPVLLENLVAARLMQKYGKGVFFLKSEKNGIDVDFYIPEKNTAIQVAYSLSNTSNDRETRNLVDLKSSMPEVKRLLILTFEEDNRLKISDAEIEVLPVYKWLLNDED